MVALLFKVSRSRVSSTLIASLSGILTISSLLQPPKVWAQVAHPFEGEGVVYVFSNNQWREAFIQQISGQIFAGTAEWRYAVRFMDAPQEIEQNISPHRIRTVAQAQSQGLTANVYDLSSQAGIDQILHAHNQARQAVGVAPLTWSPALAESAQRWANVLLTEGRFEHSPDSYRQNGRVGENLAARSSSAAGGSLVTPARAIQGWLDENRNYNYADNSCAPGSMCGHYTQVVWANTTEVGCAVARTADARRDVWVCHYSPAGNIIGQRPY